MDRRCPRLSFLFCLLGLVATSGLRAQADAVDSTYLRMTDRSKALEAMRFDLDAYSDSLRRYRDALDHNAYRVDASSKDGELRQARLGLLRRDAKQLDWTMKRLRKQLKRTPPTTEEAARACGDLVRRTKELRTRLVEEGVHPQQ